MGFNISGIAISKNFKDNQKGLQQQLGLTLEFVEEINFEKASKNWKEEGICDIYFGEKGTLLFLDAESCTDPWSIEDGNTFAFALSEMSMAFTFNYCEGRILKRSLIESNGAILYEEGGTDVDDEDEGEKDTAEEIWEQIGIVLGQTFWSIDATEKCYRYNVLSVDKPRLVKEKKKRAVKKVATQDAAPVGDIRIIDNDPADLSAAEVIFDALVSENDESVLEAVNKLTADDINNYTLAYILNLTHFHRDDKVRKAAKKHFEKYAPLDLRNQIVENWKNSLMREQEYYKKFFFDHPAIDAAEYLIFSQVIRRNYFRVKPKVGIIAAFAPKTFNDDVENVFLVQHVELKKISENICKFENIGVVTLNNQPQLDFDDAFRKFSQLPRLHYLSINDSGLMLLPESIGRLGNLRKLNLRKNPISEIPQTVIFPHVEKLDIADTNINVINIKQFPALKMLVIEDKRVLDTITFQNVTHDFKVHGGNMPGTIIKKSI